MQEWLKIVLAVLALAIGASAPTLIVETLRPGSIAPLVRPAPGRGEPQREHQAPASDEHQSPQSEQRPPQTSSPNEPGHNHGAVGPKPEEEGKWYTKPDWWVAGFTGGLVFVTGGLWIFTWLLWASTRQAVRDERAALDIARSNAQAARDSADALPALERAYLFFQIDPMMGNFIRSIIDGYQLRREQMPASMPSETLIRYQFVNHGKTPAILKSIGGKFVISTNLLRPLTYDDDDSAVLNFVVPSGGIFPSPIHRRVPKIASRDQPSQYQEVVDEFQGRVSLADAQGHYHHITDEESIELQCGNAFLWFYGHLVYEDIFGHAHETRFCWRYNAGYDRYDQDGADENRRT